MSQYYRYMQNGSAVPVYPTLADLPATASDGSLAITLDTSNIYEYVTGTGWIKVGGPGTVLGIGTIDSVAPSADGAVIDLDALIMQSASGTVPGLVNLTSQSILGQKTFLTGLTGTLTGHSTLDVATSSLGNLTDAGTDGIVVTGGTGAVIGSVSLAQHVADTTHNGYLSSADWNTFNSKQAAGSYITALTGDVTASGPGSAASTVAKIQSTVVSGTTGSTNVVFSDTPTLVTPVIGAATGTSLSVTGQLTSTVVTGTPPLVVSSTTQVANLNAATAGSATTATNATNVATTATNSTNAAFFLTFVASSTSSNQGIDTASGLSFNPSTNSLSTTTFVGALTGVASGNLTLATPHQHGVLISGSGNATTALAAASAGTLLSGQGTSSDPSFTATPTLGVPGTTAGTLGLAGVTAGTFTQGAADNTTDYAVKWPAAQASGIKTLQNDGSGNLSWSAAGSGTVTSVTFTGDGTVLSSTPSSAVTSSGTLTAAIKNQNANTFFLGPSSGGAAQPNFRAPVSADFPTAAFVAPTVNPLSSTGTTTGWLFTISTSTTCAVNDTYTNNGHTYTVLAALSAQSGQVLFMSGASTPTASGTLTRSAGAGTSSVSFTASTALATYTTPTSPRGPVYLKVRMIGGGAGGTGSGTGGSGGTGGNGGTTTFGALLLIANGGLGTTQNSGVSGVGGTASLGTGPLGFAFQGGAGGANGDGINGESGGNGAYTPFGGGAGYGGGFGNAGSAAVANSGAGGGGSGGFSTGSGQAGGGGGGYIDAIITSPAGTYVYCIGSAGALGTAGTSGFAGGAGGSGYIIVEEFYQ